VPQQLNRAVDRSRRQRPARLTVHDAWQLHVGNEVLDVRCLDVGQRSVAKSVDQRLEAVVDGLGESQPLRFDVSFLVNLREVLKR